MHKHLGPGLLESAYETCWLHEFRLRGIAFVRQRPIPIEYKETKLDCGFRSDVIVEERVVVEVKEEIEDRR